LCSGLGYNVTQVKGTNEAYTGLKLDRKRIERKLEGDLEGLFTERLVQGTGGDQSFEKHDLGGESGGPYEES